MNNFSRRDFFYKSGALALGHSLLSKGVFSDTLSEIESLIKEKFKAQKELTILYPKGCKDNLLGVIRYFNTLTDCKINLVEGSLDDIAADLILKEEVKDRSKVIDISLPPTFALPDLVEAQAIIPLDEYASFYEKKINYSPSLYSLGDRYKSKLYGYQTDGDTYVMFLNNKLLRDKSEKSKYSKKFGKELKIPATWSELDNQVKFFHRKEEGIHGGALFRNKEYSGWEFWIRLHSKGLYPVDDNFVPRFLTTQAEEALSEMAEITPYLCPSVQEAGLFENFKNFGSGKKYCNFGWGGTQKYLNQNNSQVREQLSHAPPPGGSFNGVDISMPYFNWGWNFVVGKNSPTPEHAYLFCLFATVAKASTYGVREIGGYFDPFRAEHYSDPQIIKTYGSSFLENHKKCMENSIPDFYFQGAGTYLSSLRRSVYAASNGLIPVKFALKKIQEEWEVLTEKMGRENQKKQWHFLKSLYPKKLAGVLK